MSRAVSLSLSRHLLNTSRMKVQAFACLFHTGFTSIFRSLLHIMRISDVTIVHGRYSPVRGCACMLVLSPYMRISPLFDAIAKSYEVALRDFIFFCSFDVSTQSLQIERGESMSNSKVLVCLTRCPRSIYDSSHLCFLRAKEHWQTILSRLCNAALQNNNSLGGDDGWTELAISCPYSRLWKDLVAVATLFYDFDWQPFSVPVRVGTALSCSRSFWRY